MSALPYESATSGDKALGGLGHGPGGTTHGHTAGGNWTHKYRAWCGMLNRIREGAGAKKRWYAGVKLHPAWRQFEAFNADVADPPTRAHTLDRIDGDKGYVPGNVRWATRKEQARNRRSNRLVTIAGRTQCLAAWAEELGIGESTLRWRLAHGREINPPVPETTT